MIKRGKPIFGIQLSALAFLFLLPFGTKTTLSAQDARFSQIQASPLQLNPALTGIYRGDYRLSINYRELYASILGDEPYRTMAAGFDSRIPVAGKDYLGLGFTAMRDQAGIGNFNRSTAHLSVSYLKQLNGRYRGRGSDQYLVAGAQAGFGQYSVASNQLWFGTQYDQTLFSIDHNRPTLELFDNIPTRSFADVNAGVLWYVVFEERNSLYLGAALNHLNKPNISLTEFVREALPQRWVATLGGEIPLNKELSALPSLAFMQQGVYMSTTLGTNFRYTSREWKEVALRAGAWVHISNNLENNLLSDALIIGAVLETERINLGLSYDLTVSKLALANDSRGAFEISIQYIQPEKTRRPKVNCPNF